MFERHLRGPKSLGFAWLGGLVAWWLGGLWLGGRESRVIENQHLQRIVTASSGADSMPNPPGGVKYVD
jgi:hypothetical protein